MHSHAASGCTAGEPVARTSFQEAGGSLTGSEARSVVGVEGPLAFLVGPKLRIGR